MSGKARQSQVTLKKAKELECKSHVARTEHALRKSNPSSPPLIGPSFPPLWFSHFLSCSRPSSSVGYVKGQVTRAQEAEELYLVKRELATVKQQGEEASAQLEQAKTTTRQHQPHAVRRGHRVPSWQVALARIPPGL